MAALLFLLKLFRILPLEIYVKLFFEVVGEGRKWIQMLPLYHFIGYIKDNNNNITDCRLIDLRTGKEISTPAKANDLKEKMKEFKRRYPNDDLVDNLSLKTDGRFQVKDNLIDEYVRACHTIGIQPLKIVKTGNGYAVIDIPDNIKNIQIPKFVQAININKRLNWESNRENNRQNESIMVSNKDLDIKLNALVRKLGEQVDLHDKSRMALNEQKEILENILNKVSESDESEHDENNSTELLDEQRRLLEAILEKLEHFENNQEDTNSIVEGHLRGLKGLMEEIKADDSDEEIFRLCEELKNEIEENGRTILELKNKLETECNSLSSQYNEILENLCNGDNTDKGILAIPESAGFISGNMEPCFKDSARYENVMRENNIDVYIPFDKLVILKKWLEYYYYVLTSMKLTIDSTDPSFYEDIEHLQRTDTKMKLKVNQIKNSVHNFNKNPMDIGENICIDGTALMMQGVGGVAKVVGNRSLGGAVSNVGSILKETNAKKRENVKCEKLELLKSQYLSTNVIDGFYGETDRDTAIYVLEEKYAPKGLKIKLSDGEYKKDLEYKELLRLFQDNIQIEDNRTSLNHIIFDEEMKKRIALAYICARKIIRGSTNIVNGLPTEIPLSINPQCPVEFLSSSNINGDIEERIKIRRLYYAIMLEIVYASLLIEGFEPKFARKEVIEKLKLLFENGIDGYCTCGKLYELKPDDMRNLRFDLQTYA